MNISKEWAKLFLFNWNRAVELWNEGELFEPHYDSFTRQEQKIKKQQEYARVCCAWLIPNGFQEPHCVAQGE